MIFQCKHCYQDNIFLRCLLCFEKFPVDDINHEPICTECMVECEKIYINAINKKKQLAMMKAIEIKQIETIPKKYQSFLIDFDGDD